MGEQLIMKIKFRDAGQRGYFVQANGKEYGAVTSRGGVIWGKAFWVVNEVRGKARADGPSFKDVQFKTRKAAAEALIQVVQQVEGK